MRTGRLLRGALAGLAVGLSAFAWGAAPGGRFVVQGNETVRDGRTGLVWPHRPSAGKLDWAAAKAWCEGLGLAGGGWRLPSRKELETLVDRRARNPAMDVTAFPAGVAGGYWTATPYVGTGGKTWQVDFADGSATPAANEARLQVTCVR